MKKLSSAFMKPFFDSPEAIARLQFHADQWIGTPFMPHAAVKGSGACCQRLAGAIYHECGAIPDALVPTGPMDWSHANKVSLIEEHMATRLDFTPIEPIAPGWARPGDMVGFQIGACLHHCGIVVAADGKFIHCLRGPGTAYSSLRDATYMIRLARIWRPIILS